MLSSIELSTLAHLIVEEIEQRAKNYNFFTAEQVQFIGNKFVLYKRNDAEPKIELVKAKK